MGAIALCGRFTAARGRRLRAEARGALRAGSPRRCAKRAEGVERPARRAPPLGGAAKRRTERRPAAPRG
ncbi:hypothetical protein BE20_09315 [Sorangium cellulosum]|nr:hypothetical protein BE20_09315 [Sorangium cellulosum]